MSDLLINTQDAYTTWGVRMGEGFLDVLGASSPMNIDEAQYLKTLAAGYDTQILVIVELAAQGGFHFQRGVAVRTLAP